MKSLMNLLIFTDGIMVVAWLVKIVYELQDFLVGNPFMRNSDEISSTINYTNL